LLGSKGAHGDHIILQREILRRPDMLQSLKALDAFGLQVLYLIGIHTAEALDRAAQPVNPIVAVAHAPPLSPQALSEKLTLRESGPRYARVMRLLRKAGHARERAVVKVELPRFRGVF
jgi:hypothetical protein